MNEIKRESEKNSYNKVFMVNKTLMIPFIKTKLKNKSKYLFNVRQVNTNIQKLIMLTTTTCMHFTF